MITATVIKDSISHGAIRLTTLLIRCPSHMLIGLLPIRELSITTRSVDLTGDCEAVCTSSKWLTVLDQIAGCELWDKITGALSSSRPVKLDVGEWHLPFVDDADLDAAVHHVVTDYGISVLLTDTVSALCLLLLTRVSVSRVLNNCQLLDDRVEQIKNDLEMFSPGDDGFGIHRRDAYDHQATPDDVDGDQWRSADLHGNLTGWCQYRQIAQQATWKKQRRSA